MYTWPRHCATHWHVHLPIAECHRKLNTSQGLSTHMYQVHKISLKE